MQHYSTCTDEGYLVRFLAMYESLQAHCKLFHLWVLVLDSKSLAVVSSLPNATAVPLAAIEDKVLLAAKANRTRIEYVWTLKTSFMHYLLLSDEMYGLTWLGADCMIFSDPRPIFNEIGDAPCAIVPHRFSPRCTPKTTHPGIYNGDFCYVRNNQAGRAFIKWWAGACVLWCFWRHETKHGRKLYVDQKWLDNAPQEWGAHVLQHKGAHLAPWNQERCTYSFRDGQVYVDNVPLLWYHFHKGLQHGFPGIKPFVQKHIYEVYRVALGRAQARLGG